MPVPSGYVLNPIEIGGAVVAAQPTPVTPYYESLLSTVPVDIHTAPAFPASTVAVTNTKGKAVTAYITNGAAAITQVALGGINTGMNIDVSKWGVIKIPAGQTIAFTYASGTPTWKWIGD